MNINVQDKVESPPPTIGLWGKNRPRSADGVLTQVLCKPGIQLAITVDTSVLFIELISRMLQMKMMRIRYVVLQDPNPFEISRCQSMFTTSLKI